MTQNGLKIGLYSAGLRAYWSQFNGLKERIEQYNSFICNKLSAYGKVYNFGLVDNADCSVKASDFFIQNNVDIIFLHSATYFTSDSIIPIHLQCKVPCIVLNLQPSPQIDYAKTDTGEWIAQCVNCPIPEVSNAFNRANITFNCINGLLGLDFTPKGALSNEITNNMPQAIKAWKEIEEWCKAAYVKHCLNHSRFGFLGGNYSGMLDLYSDLTMISAQTGVIVDILEMCDLYEKFETVTEEQIKNKINEIKSMFEISGDSPSDTRVRKPTDEQIQWSAKVAVAQELLVKAHSLDALAYYYHSYDGNIYEELQSGFIVGHSLLTAKGVPCAGEADIKTALGMKMCDLLGIGGSVSEMVLTDYVNDTILIGHDGPFHIKISDQKPILRGMGVYHGKRGTGISGEAKVKPGPVTLINVTQTNDGKLKFIVSEAEATNGQIMCIGNTQTPVKFSCPPDEYMEKWFKEAPTHHCALSVGHNAQVFKKIGILLNIPTVIL